MRYSFGALLVPGFGRPLDDAPATPGDLLPAVDG
jgi:hypothetical protein